MAYGKRLGFDEIFEGVLDGITQGMEKFDIQVGLIHIIPRPLDVHRHEESTREFLRYKKSIHMNAHRLCGFDLADSETELKPETFIPLINSVRGAGAGVTGVTVHTGENTDARHVREAIDAYSPDRIGHGIRIVDNPELMEMVKERNIHLEICLTSNWLTRSVESIEKHPFPQLFKAGVSVSINSDDPHLMDIDLVDEYELVREHYDLTYDDLYRVNKKAISHSFLDEDIRRFVEITYFNN